MSRYLRVFTTVLLCCAVPTSVRADSGLQEDVFLHPADAFSASVLSKGEWIYGQSPMTFPFPSWMFWGCSDRVTLLFDLLPFFYGMLSRPHLPIPSVNCRLKLRSQDTLAPALALESMAFYIWPDWRGARYDDADWYVAQHGLSAYLRMNAGWRVSPRTNVHLSMGAGYFENIEMRRRRNGIESGEAVSGSVWEPMVSVGIDHRPSPWLAYVASVSAGNTFTYVENLPGKLQVVYGFRFAPFYRSPYGFLKTMRLEVVALYAYFPALMLEKSLLLPVLPYVYWQWGGGSQTPENRFDHSREPAIPILSTR